MTGRYDVREAAGGALLGVVTRGGRFYDAAGRRLGRLRDARTWRQHAGEAVLVGTLDALVGGSGTDAGVGPRGYVVVLGERVAGTLSRERVPFVDPAAEPKPRGPLVRALARVLPGRAADALLAPRPPHAWKLDVPDPAGVEEPLLLAAAILAVEMALW